MAPDVPEKAGLTTVRALLIALCAPILLAAQAPAPRRVWALDARVSSAFDSNIHHDEEDRDAVGAVTRLGIALRSSPTRPLLAVGYGVAVYRFTNTDRWNRVQHDLDATLAPRVPGRVRPELAAEARFGSATEDRELANQYVVQPGVEWRLGGGNRLRAYAAQRHKRYSGATGRDETNRSAGLAVRHRPVDWLEWEVGGRREWNGADQPERRYAQWTAEVEVRLKAGARDAFALEVRRRVRDYSEQLADPGDGLRRDWRWTPSVAWIHRLPSPGWEVRSEYELDHNTSTQAGAAFRAHRVEVTVRRRW